MLGEDDPFLRFEDDDEEGDHDEAQSRPDDDDDDQHPGGGAGISTEQQGKAIAKLQIKANSSATVH
jgi:hypothetical protein